MACSSELPSRTSTSPSPRPWAPRSPRWRATARPVSSGTPRVRASRWRWSCTRTWSSGQPKLINPTIIVITDRNDLDGQLYTGFQISRLLPEQPQQIRKRAELRDELTNRVSGGIYFTTLQKFGRYQDEREAGAEHPLLSDRRNIIVVVDEAHRSHYDDLDGYARHLRDALPHATLIAFTGTPISFDDRNTQEVFGDVHRRLRPDQGRRGRRHRAGVLRAPPDQGRPGRGRDRGRPRHGRRRGDRRPRRRRANPIEQSVAVINAVYGAPRPTHGTGRRHRRSLGGAAGRRCATSSPPR